MRIFNCAHCGQLVYFENSICTRCGHELGFDSHAMTLETATFRDGLLHAINGSDAIWKRCGNAKEDACNWILPADSKEAFCEACRLNRTIPDLSVSGNKALWQSIEGAKRRLVYALKRFGLPLTSMHENQGRGLAFDFLADSGSGQPVMTGHADGLVTINIAEANPAERERRRVELGEPLRTLLGHLRHEVGHYYWDLLVRDGNRLEAARATFGDERADYAEALKRNYSEGPPPDWQERHVSAYAASHPWEDFAETWTHYLHIVDTLDTAAAFGMEIEPEASKDPALTTKVTFDPYKAHSIERLIQSWLPLTYAVNSLNRSMGQPDLYPFVLSPVATEKLGFIHDLVHRNGKG